MDDLQRDAVAVVDEFSRESYAIHVARSIRALELQELLEGLFAEHGVPAHNRSSTDVANEHHASSFTTATHSATAYASNPLINAVSSSWNPSGGLPMPGNFRCTYR